MYIVVIAWLYVVLLMAFTERSITAGVLTFLLMGLAPCALLVWLFGSPGRNRAKRLQKLQHMSEAEPDTPPVLIVTDDPTESVPDKKMHQHDRADTKADQGKLP